MNQPYGRTRTSLIDGWDWIVIGCVYVFVAWIVWHWAMVKVMYVDRSTLDILWVLFDQLDEKPFEFTWNDSIWNQFWSVQLLLVPGYLIACLMYVTRRPKRDYARIEYGSAAWASTEEVKAFAGMEGKIVLSQDLFLDPATRQVNLNQLVIGGSGAGKSRSKIIPDLLQANTSFVVTDPKGELYRTCAGVLLDQGYQIRMLHLIDPSLSHRYNPFHYLREDKDVLILVDTIMKNTSDPRKSGGDEFWVKSETALLQAILYYLWHVRPPEEQHLAGVLAMVTSARVAEESSKESDNPLERVFDDLSAMDARHIAVRCYDVFRLATGKTAKSILVSLAVRLSVFQTDDMAALTASDEMQLDQIGAEKTAIFLILSDSHSAFHVIAALFYSQMFQFLFYEADHRYGGQLPIPVQALLDEFANIGKIPDFDQLIATMRSRRVSVTVVLQSLSQLKNRYRDSWETIVGCCDSLIYLGTQDQETRQYISRMLGKTTIIVDGKSKTRSSRSASRSENEQRISRELMSADELLRMERINSIVFVRGYRPFWTRKFDVTTHPCYSCVRVPDPLIQRKGTDIPTFRPGDVVHDRNDRSLDQDQLIQLVQLQQDAKHQMELSEQRAFRKKLDERVEGTKLHPLTIQMIDPLGDEDESIDDLTHEIERLLQK